MQYLLDTNVFIKWINNDYSILSPEQLVILENPNNTLFVSTASIHEMAVKVRKGNLEMSMPFEEVISNERQRLNIQLMPVKEVHYLHILSIPQIKLKATSTKLHADPFDLLIIAQGMIENSPVLSTDAYFPDYEGLIVIS
jgi:PIN domain nuclease of toxin-antitoxin system